MFNFGGTSFALLFEPNDFVASYSKKNERKIIDMYKINVLVITYNQQDVIGRALDSVLCQKEYGLNKIIVADDHSSDHNWDIISKYVHSFPQYIEAYQNKTNLGIYQNMDELVRHRGNADLYYFLSGDDALADNLFKKVQEYIVSKNININEAVGIYSDWKDINLDGSELYHKPEFIEGINPLSLYIRGKIGGRSQLISNKLICHFKPSVFEKGLALAEGSFDSQAFIYGEKLYYIPILGSLSYRGKGISTQLGLGKSDYWTIQRIDAAKYFINNILTSEEDINYYKYIIEYSNFYIKPSFTGLFKAVFYYNKGKLKGVRYTIKDYFWSVYPLLRYFVLLVKNRYCRK